MGRRAEDPVARFLRYVDRRGDDECWPWTGSLYSTGYGCFRLRADAGSGSRVAAHRFAYATFVGPIPEGYEIDHVAANGCTQRACVNWLRHLEAVTGEENRLRYSGPTDICPQGHDKREVGRRSDGTCAQCNRDRVRRWRQGRASTVSIGQSAG